MRKSAKSAPLQLPWDSEVNLLIWLATCVSVFSFLFFYRSGEILLYGDAVAHINIARRVFDSKTPGLLQLGTVWLPLPHLLMIPFLISKEMWQRGTGGSIPSMAAYVFGVTGMLRLTRGVLSRTSHPDTPARIAAWTAAIIFAANPNLIYMQATAMGESLYLAFFVWAVVYFAEYVRRQPKAFTKCGLCLAAACLTRYDGWFLTAAITGVVLLEYFIGDRVALLAGRQATREQAGRNEGGNERELSERAAFPGRAIPAQSNRLLAPVALMKFVLIAAAAPVLWLAYNGIVYRNPLEFENGPYSAKAIERKTQSAGNPGHPGSGNPLIAEMYFLKAAESNVAQNPWLQRLWLLLAILGAGGLIIRSSNALASRAWLSLLFLLVPLPFYALSIAYGGVPIFLPTWWPFSHYNDRYGLYLLPAFAVALAALVWIVIRSDSWNRRLRFGFAVGVFLLIIASYVSVWYATPICLKEAQINMRSRTQLELELARMLQILPPDSTLLMYLGDHVGALERAGIPLKRTINEGNHRVWEQPTDPEGLWERALANPSHYADYVLAFEGDPVWQAVHNLHLRALIEIHVTGQAPAILYQAR